MNKNRFIALVMELFFEEVLMKKNKEIGLNYMGIWYYPILTEVMVNDPATALSLNKLMASLSAFNAKE
jgi:hypothetical protein